MTAKDLKRRLLPLHTRASEICESELSIINQIEESGCRTLATFGSDDLYLISGANKISDIAEIENGRMVINNPAKHLQIGLELSQPEKDRIKFYTGIPLKNEEGEPVGFLCVCDPEQKVLTEFQLNYLQTLADGAQTFLQYRHQTKQLDTNRKKLDQFSTLLKNSADVTFILNPETGTIENVNADVDTILGYTPDDITGTPFQDLVDSEQVKGTPVDKWLTSEKQINGRYKLPLKFIDHQNDVKWLLCNFIKENDKWYVSAGDISDQKEAERGIVELKEKFRKVVSVATDLIYELDWQTGELTWGDDLTAVLGYPNTERYVNYNWWLDKIHPDDLKNVLKDISETVESDSEKMKLAYRIRTYEGSYKFVMNSNYVVRDKDGTPGNIIGAIVDVSDLVKSEKDLVKSEKKSNKNKKLLEEKETLLMEIHHRVKNNLAVVSGILQLQAMSVSDEQVQEKLFASTSRIKTMATIHELLYKSASFTDLKLNENIELLISSITDTYQGSVSLETLYDLDAVELNINQAIPFSLIVNEVVTNVLKHAYDYGESGTLNVSLHEENGDVKLKIRDNGKGLPDGFEDQTHDGSLGMKLIETLASQLDGDYTYESLDNGAEFKLTFKKQQFEASADI